jgi:SAM-dependent methyltransferase/uncharacterized protein YbaR (Trm112 family)
VRREHFELVAPVCPRCRVDRGADVPLTLAVVTREQDDDVLHGALHCSDAACRLEYPIIDGIPVLVPQLRTVIAQQLDAIVGRDDLPESTESLLGDAAGPGSTLDTTRQHLSTYAWDHYGDLDPHEDAVEPRPGAVVRLLERALELVGDAAATPVLDLGCAVGRTTFELARRCPGPVLGVDLNLAMLRTARRAMTEGIVRYPRRRVGVVYDRREFAAPFDDVARRVDFWAADALALPVRADTLGLVVALNVLDCVASPLELLASIGRVLRPGGAAAIAAPYDWSTAATPFEAWIGGHSQRGADRGAAEPLLRALLTPDAHPQSVEGLRLAGELDSVPWHARIHDRSVVTYLAHVIAAVAT